MGIFSKLKQAWFGDVNWEKLDEEFFDNLEESLILADVGVNIATEAVNSLRNAVFSYDMKDPEQVKAELRKILLQKLSVGDAALDTAKSPTVPCSSMSSPFSFMTQLRSTWARLSSA